MAANTLEPTADQTFQIIYDPDAKGNGVDFKAALQRSIAQEERGEFEKACNTRFLAFQELVELIPDNENIELEWNDEQSQAALTTAYCSAIDHFLTGDWEMSAAELELLTELDPEDHLEATILLAYNYVAMQEWENFDEVIFDVNDKCVDKTILIMWSEWLKTGRLPEGELQRFKQHFAPYYTEFTADSHPVDEPYKHNIEQEHPDKATLARELWLQTEHLWTIYPQFIDALKNNA